MPTVPTPSSSTRIHSCLSVNLSAARQHNRLRPPRSPDWTRVELLSSWRAWRCGCSSSSQTRGCSPAPPHSSAAPAPAAREQRHRHIQVKPVIEAVICRTFCSSGLFCVARPLCRIRKTA
ncbi:hypothetical protein EYF80_059192 [Liparis tanakae]|uniref:Uncharacterized protein n=1 Tax=Liparis tanakae TaxID=230148 RepID=A0A4Z2EP29_9TELE|nr:hypothetical protein EYF80_059192 [Liparis tanakae]